VKSYHGLLGEIGRLQKAAKKIERASADDMLVRDGRVEEKIRDVSKAGRR
jgi:hypothetical protein